MLLWRAKVNSYILVSCISLSACLQQNLQTAKNTEESLQGEVEQLRQQHSREKLALQGEVNSASSQLASTESQLKSEQQELERKNALLQEKERVSKCFFSPR